MIDWRKNLILFSVFLFGAAVIGRLFYIQVIQGNFYRALAQGQQKIFPQILGERGEIFLENGLPLAINRDWQLCFISPPEIQDEVRTANILAALLNLEEDFVLKKIEQKETLFAILKHKLSEEEIKKLQELKLAGVYLRKESLREYPQGTLASHIIGFLGGEEIGQYGVEGYYNEILEGKKETVEQEKGPAGFLTFPLKKKENQGSDLILTVDYDIQHQAEKLLKKANSNLRAEGGQILVINPKSGKILALAQEPQFDPNFYFQEKDFEIFQNALIQKIFEPGSVFKPITMATGLNEAKITPETTYRDPGEIKIGGYTIYNYEQRIYPGEISMTEVLEKSINSGAVFAQSQIPHHIFLDYIKKFGIFERTGIDLQGEVFSENEEFQKGYEINFATASFGQGIEMTPIQLAQAFTVFANEGKMVKPYIVEKFSENFDTTPKVVISSETTKKITNMLISVVENGFGKGAKIPGYWIAGKTGTAQVAEKGVYSADKTWQTFVGYFPALSPQFLILVKLDNPQTKTAEYSAVPIFHDLAEFIINLYQLPPDYE